MGSMGWRWLLPLAPKARSVATLTEDALITSALERYKNRSVDDVSAVGEPSNPADFKVTASGTPNTLCDDAMREEPAGSLSSRSVAIHSGSSIHSLASQRGAGLPRTLPPPGIDLRRRGGG